MERDIKELVEELERLQRLYNQVVMEIGELIAKHGLTNDRQLVPIINRKIEVLKKLETEKTMLEKEIANHTSNQ